MGSRTPARRIGHAAAMAGMFTLGAVAVLAVMGAGLILMVLTP